MKIICCLTFSGLFPSMGYHKASLEFIHCHSWLQLTPIALPLSDWLPTWGEKGIQGF